jgi:hypothetical protein
VVEEIRSPRGTGGEAIALVGFRRREAQAKATHRWLEMPVSGGRRWRAAVELPLRLERRM